MNRLKQTLAVLLLLPCFAATALAEDRHGGDRHGDWHRDRDEHRAWHGEIRNFHEHDLERWRGGRWSRGNHDGRIGWWWIVGGAWYFYPWRIEPYPDPYQPPIVVLPPYDAPPQYWYYCANPAGYYPYVPQCPVGWQRVPATPPN